MKKIIALQLVRVIDTSNIPENNKRVWFEKIIPQLSIPQIQVLTAYCKEHPAEMVAFDRFLNGIDNTVKNNDIENLQVTLRSIIETIKKQLENSQKV